MKGIREICFVLETPEVPDIPAEVFLELELACDRVVSLLTEIAAIHNEIGKESTYRRTERSCWCFLFSS